MNKIALITLAAGMSVLATWASAEEINASIWLPASHPLTAVGYVDWAKAIEERSGGDLKINVFTGAALLPPQAHLTGVRDGVAELGYHAGTYTPADMQEDNVIAMLGIGMTNSLATALASTDFFVTDPEMQALYARNGIVYLGGYSTPGYILICTERVASIADLAGKKIRMPGAVHAKWAKSVGAVPVSVPSSEMFTGLEKGQLDCAANAANDLKNRSLWDVAKHVSAVDLGRYFAGWQYGMNAAKWASLSAEHRRLLLDTIAEYIVKTTNAYEAEAAVGFAEAPSHGVEIAQPDAELRAAITEFARTTAVELGVETGRDKFGIVDPKGLIDRFKASLDKWNTLLAGADSADEAAVIALLKSEVFDRVDETTYGL